MMRRVAWLALAAIAACGAPTGPGGSGGAALVGTWSYAGTQQSPAATLAGTLVVDRASGGAFTGSADVVVSVNGTATGRWSGPASGMFADSNTVDFDVALTDGGDWRQLAQVRGDSLVGGWVQTDAGGTLVASGSFTAVRTAP